MAATTIDTVDRIAMFVGGGLVLLGTTVMGIAESFFVGHTVAPDGNLGDVVVHASFDPRLRAYLIALGFAILFVYAAYRVGVRRRA